MSADHISVMIAQVNVDSDEAWTTTWDITPAQDRHLRAWLGRPKFESLMPLAAAAAAHDAAVQGGDMLIDHRLEREN